MKIVSFLLRQSRGLGALAIFTGMISGASSSGVVALLSASARGEGGERWPVFVFLVVLVPVSMVLTQYLVARLTSGAVYELRRQLARRILATPLRRLEELGSHRLLTALTEDIGNITAAVNFLPMLWINVVFLFGLLGYLAWLSWFELLLLAVTTGLALLSYRLIAKHGIARMRIVRQHGDDLFHHYRALTHGTKELKLHHRRRGEFLELYDRTADTMRSNNIVARTLFNAAGSWVSSVLLGMLGVIVYVIPRFRESAEPATLTTFVIVMLLVLSLLQEILDRFAGLGRANVSLDKLDQLGFSLDDMAEPGVDEPVAEAAAFETLELAGVTHSYRHEGSDHETFTLGPLDLIFRPGELVVLSGGNGSGKTTLAKLILGLYRPESGAVRLDGQTVDGSGIEAYRQLFSVVFSDFFLFEKLLGLGSLELDEQARQYLEKLQLSHKVEVEKGALSTVDLSQGQRKRLALLTSYLEDRPILLFDEWAADQDPHFKDVFYRQLLPELKRRGKCVIAISHDDHYFDVADRVIRLDYGQLEYDVPTERLAAAKEM